MPASASHSADDSYTRVSAQDTEDRRPAERVVLGNDDGDLAHRELPAVSLRPSGGTTVKGSSARTVNL
jgi:hypothetical protein